MDLDFVVPNSGVIFGHEPCQTREAKWLCLVNVFEKCHRPNMYDIGGTYIEDLPHFWFYYKNEIVGKLFLIHIFVTCRYEGAFSVSICGSNEISFRRKQHLAYLTSLLKTFRFENTSDMSQHYLTTYSFSEMDLELLNTMKLYIPISFENTSTKEGSQGYDFKALLEDPFGADFVIESAEGDKFNVHKILLSRHSEVFRAMLKENTAESQQSYMKIIDVYKHDLYGMLEYIYTSSVEDVEGHNFFNLLMLSDRYNLKGLRDISEIALSSQLCLDNVIETLVVADLYNAEDLKIAALKFIKCNYSAIQNQLFEELSNVELMREVCNFLLPRQGLESEGKSGKSHVSSRQTEKVGEISEPSRN
ncbi:BTB/POZ domain-containing protein 8 [Bicyclus anynana]|uniref:BTB/POZ domain-containing protein 8 n=1 Tax=Bicyclus anynana TaxID=110368 RepID=A0A6J1NS19_BICAN|nr:BTB/POZ domain-containing protein 8 [Bicyclus anynana]